MDNINLNQIVDDLVSGAYVFETDEYANALNELINIQILPNSISLLERLAKSNNFANTFAASFILENISTPFLQAHKQEIYLIIKLLSEKKYFRANFYLIEVLLRILENKEDYILYLEFIHSDNHIEHNQAISLLIFLSDEDFKKFNEISIEYNFSIFFNIPTNVDKKWFINLTQNTSLIYKKIVLLAVYRKFPCKQFVAQLADDNPDLFDFVFFLPSIQP